ncbi:undecaprenyl-phosphate glucose phosphotransferase, partial [Endothiovibrio diazotrophicus]
MDRHHLNFLPFLDYLCVLLTGYLAYVVRAGDGVLDNRYLLVILVAGFITISLFSLTRVYLFSEARLAGVVRQLFLPLLLVGLVVAGLGYLSKSSEHYSRIWAALWFALCFVAMVGGRLWLVHLGRSERLRYWLARRAVLVGEAADVVALYLELERRRTPWLMVSGVFVPAGEMPSGLPKGVAVGTVDELLHWSKGRSVDDVVVVPPGGEGCVRAIAWLNDLRLIPANLHVGPMALFEVYPEAKRIDIAGMPLITAVRHPLTSINRVVKMGVDLLLVTALLIPALPLMGLIAVAIRIDSRGPALFQQQRYGFRNEVFTVYKFRTMSHGVADDPDLPQARRGDPRVTRLGRLLRRFSLDELPQLFNVLNGSMSLVGPRPHAVPHNDKYAGLLDRYLERHNVKPGITGWAQVNGHRGETDTVEKMRRRVEFDLYYVKNWSPLLDLEIIMRTVLVVLSGRNA